MSYQKLLTHQVTVLLFKADIKVGIFHIYFKLSIYLFVEFPTDLMYREAIEERLNIVRYTTNQWKCYMKYFEVDTLRSATGRCQTKRDRSQMFVKTHKHELLSQYHTVHACVKSSLLKIIHCRSVCEDTEYGVNLRFR